MDKQQLSDFSRLRLLLIRSELHRPIAFQTESIFRRTHFWSLIESTNEIHYENFRSEKLLEASSIGTGEEFDVGNMEELKVFIEVNIRTHILNCLIVRHNIIENWLNWKRI